MSLASLSNSALSTILSNPHLWSAIQMGIGATQWKRLIYPSVIRKKGTMLDFGCSAGVTTAAFLDHEYYGVDIDVNAIRVAKNIFQRHPAARFFCQNILTDKLPDYFFDNVLFFGTAHHIADDELTQILRVLMRSLRADGELHFFDPIVQTDKDPFITRLLTKYDRGRWMRTEAWYLNFFKNSGYDIATWKIFPSPDSFIKLQDFLYVRLIHTPASVN